MNESFYESNFGKQLALPRVNAVVRLIEDALEGVTPGTPLKMLDAGCGNMLNSEAIAAAIQKKTGHDIELDGWEISEAAVREAKGRGLRASLRDISRDSIADVEVGAFDIVLFIEVLEHVVDTDHSIANIHRLLKPGGLLVLTTPNLASWYNRILLPLGFQPHCTEVSFLPEKFGCRWIGRIISDGFGSGTAAAGHLRVFTWRALREFITHYKFQILKARGVSNHERDLVSRLLARYWVGGSGDIAIIARKLPSSD